MMRYFEDLQIGEMWSLRGAPVDGAEAEDFARRYDPEYIPPSGVGWIHRGPQISPWQAAALGWKLLTELAAAEPVIEATFSRPTDVQWLNRVYVADQLRIEVELVELFPAAAAMREHGLARVAVSLITTGPMGFAGWADDDQELVDDIALTFRASLKARRRELVSPYHGIS
jgi:acyl dehydratase